ncbi:protein kinase domain-containing protein [Thermococcus sp.]
MKPISISETADKKYWIKKYEFEGMEAEAKAVALMPNGDIVIVGSIKPKETDARSSGLVARLDKKGNVKWVRILGGNKDDEFNDVKIAPNGDIIVAGYTESFGAGTPDHSNVWVLRLDENGNVKWQRSFGGEDSGSAWAVAIAENGDIIVVGTTSRANIDKDICVLKLDGTGGIKWQKTYGGSADDEAYAVAVTENGDIIVAGYTRSFGDGGRYVWVLRLDKNGNVKWQKSYGEKWNSAEAYGIAITPNGDIIIIGDIRDNAWILLLDPKGNVKWQKAYGGKNINQASAVTISPMGDIFILGFRTNENFEYTIPWILSIDITGNIKWHKIYGKYTFYDEMDIVSDGSFIAITIGNKVLYLPSNGEIPECRRIKNAKAITMDTNAIVKNTRCKVKKAGGLFSKFKITDTTATVRTAVPKVEVLCEWSPGRCRKPWPGHLINGRCYIVKTRVIDEWALRSALEELDKELSSIDFIQPLPGEIVVYPFKGIIEGENLFVTRYIISRGPGESGIIPSKKFVEILDRIKNTAIPEIGVPDKVSRGLITGEAEAKPAPKISEVPKVPERAKAVEETKTLEGFPSALLERYEPLEFLGEGGFARVYKVRRRKDGKIVALKIPRIDKRTSSLFIKEVAAWYNLNHENIVRLYRADILPVPYLEMEFIEGVEVDGELFRDLGAYPKPVDEKTALKLIKGIALGLAHAHSKGIYHLDLKPLNVLLKADLTPKITDWGLAKISARSSLSRHYGYSPLYAAPEQLDEETFGVPDHKTDIYQLGLIFYELLTEELPYKATSPGALVGKILYTKPKPVSEFNEKLRKFDGIFEKLLAKRKEERYQSVEEFLSALESLGELEREKEELRKTSMAMRKSRSREEFEKLRIESVRKTVKIAILSARLNDKAELLAALDDLKFYTRENLDDLLNAIAQVELLLKEGIPIGPEVEERVKALVLRIEGEALR